jgi:hypothetical protein
MLARKLFCSSTRTQNSLPVDPGPGVLQVSFRLSVFEFRAQVGTDLWPAGAGFRYDTVAASAIRNTVRIMLYRYCSAVYSREISYAV